MVVRRAASGQGGEDIGVVRLGQGTCVLGRLWLVVFYAFAIVFVD